MTAIALCNTREQETITGATGYLSALLLTLKAMMTGSPEELKKNAIRMYDLKSLHETIK